ncbi:MAG: hypothetical protein LLG00_15480, partial [Planctomycetaceae bacterium]|nr:hypothetical protein [Planctomycetaceae bacterium]
PRYEQLSMMLLRETMPPGEARVTATSLLNPISLIEPTHARTLLGTAPPAKLAQSASALSEQPTNSMQINAALALGIMQRQICEEHAGQREWWFAARKASAWPFLRGATKSPSQVGQEPVKGEAP